jgi:Pseudouridylate synthases, 23S RNA-specific
MDFRLYTITRDDSDRRIDRVVRRFLPELSLSAVYKLLRKGLIRVDAQRVSPDFHVQEGSELKIAAFLFPSQNQELPPEAPPPEEKNSTAKLPVDIILETHDLLFVNKPAGIPVHGEGSLDRLIPPSNNAEKSLSFRTGPLHRLDSGTSGLIAFSRSLEGARWFSDAIHEHRMEKHYLGIARGRLEREAEWRDVSDDGKNMITFAVPVACSKTSQAEIFTLVRYRIVTGRKHQIRIQTARHGHALVGDRRHGDSYFLHAWQLAFPSERLHDLPDVLVAPLPTAFKKAIADFFGADVLAHIDNGELYWSEHGELQ